MELFIIARFHARPGNEAALEAAIRSVAAPTRKEPGCLGYEVFHSIRDSRLYFIRTHWVNETAYDAHIELPHTVRFVEWVEGLIDHPLDVTRTRRIQPDSG